MQNDTQLLDVLTREGVLISVSVRYWRATRKLTAEDLGLRSEDVTDRLIRLGHKKLLPKEELRPFGLIESRAHAFVEANTFPFLGGLGHFLPNAKIEEVSQRLSEFENAFRVAEAEFLNGYEEIRGKAEREWQVAARRLVGEPDRLVATIFDAFPTPARIESYFAFTTQVYQIRVPEELDLQATSFVEQREISEARKHAAQAAAHQIETDVTQFVGECAKSLREHTASICEEMLASIQQSKKGVHQKTLNRLSRFIDQFKDLNFVDDKEMEGHLDSVRSEFLERSAEDYRNDEDATVRLKQALHGLADTARDLVRQDSSELVDRFGQMGRRKFRLSA